MRTFIRCSPDEEGLTARMKGRLASMHGGHYLSNGRVMRDAQSLHRDNISPRQTLPNQGALWFIKSVEAWQLWKELFLKEGTRRRWKLNSISMTDNKRQDHWLHINYPDAMVMGAICYAKHGLSGATINIQHFLICIPLCSARALSPSCLFSLFLK